MTDDLRRCQWRVRIMRSGLRRPYIIRNPFGWAVWVGGYGLVVTSKERGA